jgi:hypothetical protein
MKYLACLAAVFACSVSAQAAGPVTSRSLDNVGLSGMRRISDAHGQQVRAKFAAVYGQSHAAVGSFGGGSGSTASSTNGYVAAGHTIAGGLTVSGAGNNTGTFAVGGGFSVAGAH